MINFFDDRYENTGLVVKYRRDFLLDTDDDAENLPGLDVVRAGSMAYSVASGALYILNGSGEWVKRGGEEPGPGPDPGPSYDDIVLPAAPYRTAAGTSSLIGSEDFTNIPEEVTTLTVNVSPLNFVGGPAEDILSQFSIKKLYQVNSENTSFPLVMTSAGGGGDFFPEFGPGLFAVGQTVTGDVQLEYVECGNLEKEEEMYTDSPRTFWCPDGLDGTSTINYTFYLEDEANTGSLRIMNLWKVGDGSLSDECQFHIEARVSNGTGPDTVFILQNQDAVAAGESANIDISGFADRTNRGIQFYVVNDSSENDFLMYVNGVTVSMS